MKANLKVKAIELRGKGLTYSEILKEVPVAKSTLSLWLRSVGLSKRQKQRITKKKLDAGLRGAKTRKRQRLLITREIKEKAKQEIAYVNLEQLRLLGAALYWAEGTKEKEYNPSMGIIFSNSDLLMIKLFIQWLEKCLKVTRSRIYFELFIHRTHSKRLSEIIKNWAKNIGFLETKFDKIYYKKNKISTKRRNVGIQYFGLIRVRVKSSTNLNRKIAGWVEGICTQCGVV